MSPIPIVNYKYGNIDCIIPGLVVWTMVVVALALFYYIIVRLLPQSIINPGNRIEVLEVLQSCPPHQV